MMKQYRGVVLSESLEDVSVLGELDIVYTEVKQEQAPSSEQPQHWTWYGHKVDSAELEAKAQRLSNALKPRAWYTNLWCEGDYLLIFPTRIFRGESLTSVVWNEAIMYGLSIGIPLEQLTPLEDVLQTA